MKQYHCDENSAVFFFWSEMQKWFAYGPADATATSIISCFIKIRIGFTFLVPATPVVLEKRPLNRYLSEEWKYTKIT